MIRISDAHKALMSYVKQLERTPGKRFFPQPGQIMYAPTLEQELIKNPQGAVNKLGFFFQGDGAYEFAVDRMALQCLLTYPESRTDEDYIAALAHADDFFAAINDQAIPGVGLLTKADGPLPIPNMGVLGVRMDFSITSIS
ncbi:MAG: hypothetical protein HGB35_00070 [Geobacteraceae bacterium]|nr:hypothetical protein [Geobacteraceae bacterium]